MLLHALERESEGQILDDPFHVANSWVCQREDVHKFIITQRLSHIEIGWQMGNFFRVEANDVHDSSLCSHVCGLPSFTSQATLDTLWDFVGE